MLKIKFCLYIVVIVVACAPESSGRRFSQAMLRRLCKTFPYWRAPFQIAPARPGRDAVSCHCPNIYGMCTREMNPVCGTDNRYYANPCKLCSQKGKNGYYNDRRTPLKIKKWGRC